jgi:hypothetical protein
VHAVTSVQRLHALGRARARVRCPSCGNADCPNVSADAFFTRCPGEPTTPAPTRRALAAMVSGRAADEQPRQVRRHLRQMEADGLVWFADGVWHLTDAGRVVLRAWPTP